MTSQIKVQVILAARDRTGQGTKKARRNIDRITLAMSRLKAATIGLLGLGGLAIFGARAVRAAGEWQALNNRIRTVSKTQRGFNDLQKELVALSKKTGSDYGGTVTSFTRLQKSGERLKKTQQEMLRVQETLNKAVILGGSVSSEATNGLRQFSQGLASNRLAGDELRSVLENLIGVSDALIDGLNKTGVFGKVDRGRIYELAEKRLLTADVLIDALQAAEEEVDRLYGQIERTVLQASTSLATAAADYFNNAGLIKSSISGLTTTLDFSSDNFNLIAKTARAAAIVGLLYFARRAYRASYANKGLIRSLSTVSLRYSRVNKTSRAAAVGITIATRAGQLFARTLPGILATAAVFAAGAAWDSWGDKVETAISEVTTKLQNLLKLQEEAQRKTNPNSVVFRLNENQRRDAGEALYQNQKRTDELEKLTRDAGFIRRAGRGAALGLRGVEHPRERIYFDARALRKATEEEVKGLKEQLAIAINKGQTAKESRLLTNKLNRAKLKLRESETAESAALRSVEAINAKPAGLWNRHLLRRREEIEALTSGREKIIAVLAQFGESEKGIEQAYLKSINAGSAKPPDKINSKLTAAQRARFETQSIRIAGDGSASRETTLNARLALIKDRRIAELEQANLNLNVNPKKNQDLFANTSAASRLNAVKAAGAALRDYETGLNKDEVKAFADNDALRDDGTISRKKHAAAAIAILEKYNTKRNKLVIKQAAIEGQTIAVRDRELAQNEANKVVDQDKIRRKLAAYLKDKNAITSFRADPQLDANNKLLQSRLAQNNRISPEQRVARALAIAESDKANRLASLDSYTAQGPEQAKKGAAERVQIELDAAQAIDNIHVAYRDANRSRLGDDAAQSRADLDNGLIGNNQYLSLRYAQANQFYKNNATLIRRDGEHKKLSQQEINSQIKVSEAAHENDMNKIRSEGAVLRKELRDRERKEQVSALAEYAKDAKNTAQKINQAFTDGFRGAEDAIINFVKTSKLEIKDLFSTIASEILRAQLQKNVTGPLSNSLDGFFDGLFGGSGGSKYIVGPPGASGLLGHSPGAATANAGSVTLNAAVPRIPLPQPSASPGQSRLPQVVINNYGEPKTATVREGEPIDLHTPVVEVILDDISRHGPIGQAFRALQPS